MSKATYWNDPKIANERQRELERALPTKHKPRKPRENSGRPEQKASEMGQRDQRRSAAH